MKLLQKPKDGDDILRKADIDIEKIKKEIYDKVTKELAAEMTNKLKESLGDTANIRANLIVDDGIRQGEPGSDDKRFTITVNPLTKMGIIHMDFRFNDPNGIHGYGNMFTIPNSFPYLPTSIFETIIDPANTGSIWTNERSPRIEGARIDKSRRYIVDLICFFEKR